MSTIPILDAAPLFAPAGPERSETDRTLARAANDSGFLVLENLPRFVPLGPAARQRLLALLDLPEAQRRRLWRHDAADENPNVYRGYFPLSVGVIKEGMDIGPADPAGGLPGDALTETTPLPPDALLPGWRTAMRDTFGALERVGAVLMRSLARGLALPEAVFDAPFQDGISTLRMIRYPAWPGLADYYGLPLASIRPDYFHVGGEHVDSGFVTLLQQDGVDGLQARSRDGEWLDVPHLEGTLVVNFGGLLERWTGGRIRATEHRVLGRGADRDSIPFFYEPRVDALIQPLGLPETEPFQPFRYGDHLWEAMSAFPEFAKARRFPDGSG